MRRRSTRAVPPSSSTELRSEIAGDADEERRASITQRDPLDLADACMKSVGDVVMTLAEELNDERACSRMLRLQLGAAEARIRELEAQLSRRAVLTRTH